MMPIFRMWDTEDKVMRPVEGIDYFNQVVCVGPIKDENFSFRELDFTDIDFDNHMMQWTGYTDNDGKHIFTGDICVDNNVDPFDEDA
jgi:uncharacterized phage protein (TIGR01671 family)